jgi:hypothetical protein
MAGTGGGSSGVRSGGGAGESCGPFFTVAVFVSHQPESRGTLMDGKLGTVWPDLPKRRETTSSPQKLPNELPSFVTAAMASEAQQEASHAICSGRVGEAIYGFRQRATVGYRSRMHSACCSSIYLVSVRAAQSSVHSGQKSYRRLLNEQLLSLYCSA